MKKYILFIVSAVVFAFISCSDREEIEIKCYHNLSLTINTSSLYEKYGFSDFQNAIGDGYNVGVTILLYDSQGKLADKFDLITGNFQPITQTIKKLEQDEYSLIAIQYLVNSRNNNLSDVWHLEKTESIDKVRIASNSYVIHWRDCLGIYSDKINVSSNIATTIKPRLAGSFVNFICMNFDKSNYNHVGFYFKNVASGILLNPKLTNNERLYYSDGFNQENYWNSRVYIASHEGLSSLYEYTVFMLESGYLNYCFGPSSLADENGNIYFSAYPSNNEFFNFMEGGIYTAFCCYVGIPEEVVTFLGSTADFYAWYYNWIDSL